MESEEKILCINFNQNFECFACGTTKGFRVFNTCPLIEAFSRNLGGGIGIIEMLYRCNILALVGGGKKPQYPLNKVIIWDDLEQTVASELCYKSNVKSIKLYNN